MKQKLSILFDLDGTLVDTAPDLMHAHNHVMKKFGYPTKSLADLKSSVGKGADAMIGRSIWSQAKKELTTINEKVKNKMTDEFISYYGKNILNESRLINGVKDFLNWSKEAQPGEKSILVNFFSFFIFKKIFLIAFCKL